jgi:hypothetical protein
VTLSKVREQGYAYKKIIIIILEEGSAGFIVINRNILRRETWSAIAEIGNPP